MQSPALSLLRDDSAAREGGYLPLWHEHVVCGTKQIGRCFLCFKVNTATLTLRELVQIAAGDWKLDAIWNDFVTVANLSPRYDSNATEFSTQVKWGAEIETR